MQKETWIACQRAGVGVFTLILFVFYLWPDPASPAGQNLFVVCSVPFFAGAALFASELAAPEMSWLYSMLGYLGLIAHGIYAIVS